MSWETWEVYGEKSGHFAVSAEHFPSALCLFSWRRARAASRRCCMRASWLCFVTFQIRLLFFKRIVLFCSSVRRRIIAANLSISPSELIMLISMINLEIWRGKDADCQKGIGRSQVSSTLATRFMIIYSDCSGSRGQRRLDLRNQKTAKRRQGVKAVWLVGAGLTRRCFSLV